MRIYGDSGRLAQVRTTSRARLRPTHPDELAEDQVSLAALAFGLLADATRIRMLWAMRDREQDVTSLAEAAGCRPTVASQHLSKLRLAGLVQTRRDGRHILYSLRGGHVRSLLTEGLFHADHQATGQPVHD